MRAGGARAALTHPTFRRFYAGQTISQLGDSVFYVALSWQTLASGSAADLGLVLGAYFVGQLLFLLAGGIMVDRFPRKTLVVLSDVAQGVVVGSIAAALALATLPLEGLAALAFLFGAAQAFAMPALRAFLPETVPPSALAGANSLFQGTRTVAAVAGPALGGLLIALAGTAAAFAFNAGTFALSVLLLATARRHAEAADAGPAKHAPRAGMLHDAKEGLRVVARVPWLWIGILVFALLNLVEAGSRNVALRAFVVGPLGGGPEALGLVASAHMLGTALGFFAMGALAIPPERRGRVAYASTLLSGLVFATLGLAPGVWALLGMMFAYGVFFAGFNLLWETSIMEHVPARYQGRVFSLDMLGSFVLLPVSAILAGVASEALGARVTFALAGLVMVALAMLGLLLRPAHDFRKVDA